MDGKVEELLSTLGLHDIKYMHPFAVRFRSITEYIDRLHGRPARPIRVYDSASLRRCEVAWRRIYDMIVAHRAPRSPGEYVVIGYKYPDTALIAPRKPDTTHFPDWVGLIVGGEAVVVPLKKHRLPVHPRRFYVQILRHLVKAVVLKPLPPTR